MRRPFIAGNWKLHKTTAEATALVEAINAGVAEVADRDIVVAPVFTALTSVASILGDGPVVLAGQNCYPESQGAFTGEVSPALLKDAGCRYVIVGHSERRQLFGETDGFINRKIKAVIDSGMTAIFCIGETLEERESGKAEAKVVAQMEAGLKGIGDITKVVVAYEPIWAIGTGKTASKEEANEACGWVRQTIAKMFGEDAAQKVRIQYGGSVNPENIKDLMAMDNIDGALVGGAALKPTFSEIVKF